MKILIVPSWYPSNPYEMDGSFFRNQALALSQGGHDVSVLFIHLISPFKLLRLRNVRLFSTRSTIDAGVKTLRVTVVNLFPGIISLSKLFRKLLFSYYYKKHVQDNGPPDIIHAHVALWGGWMIVQSGSCGLPSPLKVITEHTTRYARGVFSAQQLKIVRKVFEKADATIFVSRTLRKDVEHSTKARLENVHIIPNVVEKDFAIRRANSREGARDNFPIFLNVASLSKKKGHETLLKAFQKVHHKLPSARLWLVGDGPERKRLTQLANDLSITQSVKFFGKRPINEIPEIMSQANIFVTTSVYETFGVAVAEALMTGLPVISTRCGGPENFLKREDGALVDVGDTLGLTQKMIDLSANIANYKAEEIQKRAQDRFSFQAVARELTKVYRALQEC